MNRPIIAIFIAIIMPLLLAACGAESNGGKPSSEGTLTGTISIGPVCPVEPCDQSAGSIYVGRELVLLSTDGDPIRVPLADDGSFKVNLEPTTYLIRLEGCDYLGCDQAFPVEKTVVSGETTTLNVNLDTGIRSPERNQGIGQLVSDLEGLGAVVSLGDSLSQPFFSVAGQEVTVNREVVQVFTYASPKEARSDADLVDKTGFEVGTTMVSWVAPPHFFLPHFFLKDNLLVLYVGVNDAVISLLQEALGPQIAGGEITSNPPDPLCKGRCHPRFGSHIYSRKVWMIKAGSDNAVQRRVLGPADGALTTCGCPLEDIVFAYTLRYGCRGL